MEPFQRKNRKGWWFKTKDLTKPAGKQWVVRKGGDTLNQAIIAQAAFEDRMRLVELGLVDRRQAEITEKSKTPIKQVVDAYEKHLKAQKTSPGHVREAIRCVNAVLSGIGATCPNDVETSDVENWLDELIAEGRSNRTRNVYRDRMHAFCGFAKRRRMFSVNPVAEIQRLNEEADRREPSRPLSQEEFETLIDAVPDAIRKIYYLIAGRTGLRWSEIHRLTWGQIDLENGWIRLKAKHTKSRRTDDVPLNDRLVTVLKEMKSPYAGASSRVFETKPTLLTLKRDLERAGIPYENEYGQIDRKSFRTMYCTHLQAAGVPFSTAVKLMRHSDPRLTSRIYTDARLLDLRGATEALDKNTGESPPRSRAG